MKKRSVILSVCFAILTSAVGVAAEPAPPKKHPDSSKWQNLISPDLKDAIFTKGVWTFKDGVLTATKDDCIWTKATYENCVVDLEFKTDKGTNSGVIVYCSNVKNWIPNSVEVQIYDDFSNHGDAKKSPDAKKKPALTDCGAIYGHLPPAKNVVKKPGEWNRMTITCKGRMIYVILNGKAIIEMDMSKWTSAKKNPDGTDIPAWLSTPFAKLPVKGQIGLQGKHGEAAIYFRNLKIKTL